MILSFLRQPPFSFVAPLLLPEAAVAAEVSEKLTGSTLLLGVLGVLSIGLLLRSNQRLRHRLRQESHQRQTAETALARNRNELKRQVDDRAHALHQLSFYDPLTDLPNRSLLYERLSHATHNQRTERRSFALLLIDLNRFKAINDTLGHYIGDAVLQEVGIRLQKVVGSDTIYYIGGDEFAIMHVTEGTACEATEVASKIQEALTKPFMAKGLPISIGASIGLAYYPDHTTDPDNLLRFAEIAMYSAKRTQDLWAIYDPAQRKDTKSNLVLASELRKAFDQDELVLHFQPKVDLTTEAVIGFESLVRWRHPREGLMSPERFVQLAEQTGLVRPLTLWVLNAVLAQCAAWREQGIELPVAVNLSVLNLQDPYLHLQVAELLDAWAIPGSLIEIEVTESAAIDDPERACRVLGELNRLGMSVAIDDFGTGYSSLSYLRRLPIDTVKIDKSFVLGMIDEGDDAAIVRAMIDLAHNLGLRVVAEGVEDRKTWDRLARLGCDIAQGFYISRPLDAANVTRWLRKHQQSSTIRRELCPAPA